MRKINILLSVFCLLFSYSAFAQFNDTTHYHVVLTSTGSINRATNVNTYLLNNGLNFGVRKGNVDMNANNTWIYGKSNNALTNNDYSSLINVDIHTRADKIYFWGLVNYNTSFSLKVNAQLLTGGGIAFNIINNKNNTAWLNISDGVLYDKSDLFIQDSVRYIYHTYRNSLRVQFKFVIGKIITLNSSSFLQSSFEKASDYIFKTNSSASLKLNKWLNFTTALNYNNENRTVSENLLFTYGLTFERYF